MLVDRSSAHDRAYHAAREPRLIERRVLALRLEVDGVKHPGYVGIDHDDIGGGNGAPGCPPPAPKDRGARPPPAAPSDRKHITHSSSHHLRPPRRVRAHPAPPAARPYQHRLIV